MAVHTRAALPANALTLPARYYTDAALFAREESLFFRRWWMHVGRLEAMPTRGAWVTRDISGDQIIVVRTTDGGAVRAFHNVCRHRGTRLCDQDAGTFNGRIVCPYHAWTYDLEGRLVGTPHMDGTDGFVKTDYPLHSVRAEVWDGFVFVSLDPTGRALADQLDALPEKFRPWRMGDLRVAARIDYDVRANWKLVIQNYNECLHCPTLHPALNKLSHYLGGENEPIRGTYMGGRMDLNDGVETMSTSGRSSRTPLPGLEPEDHRRVYYYSLFPNFLIAPHPDYVMTHTLWPTAVDRTRIVCEWLLPAGDPGTDLADVTEFWDQTNRQDWQVCELAQAGIGSRAYTPGPYSSREDLLYAFDRFIVSALGE